MAPILRRKVVMAMLAAAMVCMPGVEALHKGSHLNGLRVSTSLVRRHHQKQGSYRLKRLHLGAEHQGSFIGLDPKAVIDEWPYLEMILKAKVYDVCVETPLHRLDRLSDRVGHSILAKREDMQPVFSFKLRGAYNLVASLPAATRDKGVVTASAGNHAQGCAFSARHLGCKAVIFMPTVTPDIKVKAVRSMGAEVRLIGDTFDEAAAHARALSEASGMPYIPPFDHPLVIAGQGTVAMELLRQASSLLQRPNGEATALDAIFVPVGGGGLVAGIASYVKRLRPEVLVIGVEPFGACAMKRSLDAGERVTLDAVDTFADGVAVKQVGAECFRVAAPLLDGVILVDQDEICAAIKDLFEDTRSILEPSGALAIAGAKKWLEERGTSAGVAGTAAGRLTVAAVASGANMNFDRLRFVAERAGTGAKTEAMLATFIPEAPGSFRAFIGALASAGASRGGAAKRSITEFKYRFNANGVASSQGRATVFYSVETESQADAAALVRELTAAGLETLDLSGNDLSKDHVRFLAGGSAQVPGEELYRIEFPERAGALGRFLDALADRWDISLFHYRSSGTTKGLVLLGVAMREGDPGREAFEATVVEELEWAATRETDNIAAQLFL